jgi:hypothetical protein
MRFRLLAALLVLLTPAACASPARPPAGAGDPLIRVDLLVSMAPPAQRWKVPDFVLLGDGTALVQGPDQGTVLTAQRRTLTGREVADLYRRAGAADLFRSHRYRMDVLDGSALRVSVVSDSGRHETVVEQPGDAHGRRGRVARFADAAARAGKPAGAFAADRIAVLLVGEYGDATDVRPWPLAGTSSCQVLAGTQMEALLATVRTATTGTRWSAGGRALSLVVRPLLPYERNCAAISGR